MAVKRTQSKFDALYDKCQAYIACSLHELCNQNSVSFRTERVDKGE